MIQWNLRRQNIKPPRFMIIDEEIRQTGWLYKSITDIYIEDDENPYQ